MIARIKSTRISLLTKWRLCAVAVLLVTLALSYTHGDGPACLWKTFFHIPCPGCGITRSLESVWHGNFLMSFRYHPLGLPLFIACILFLIPMPTLTGSWKSQFTSQRIAIAVLVIMLMVYFLRIVFNLTGSRFFIW